jgi:hypothetical protein
MAFGAGSPSQQAERARAGFASAQAVEAVRGGNGGGGGLDTAKARQRQQQELAAQAVLEQARQKFTPASSEAERFARQNRIMDEQAALSRYQPVRDPAGNIVGQITPPSEIPMGLLPLLFSTLPFEQRVYSGDPRYDPFDKSRRLDRDNGGRQQQVAPVQDPMTGQARCPDGYVFNETLQACIMDTAATSSFQPTAPVAPTAPSGDYYARMGLLDQPPAGLLEAGFGSPQDFAAANTAFRMGAATRPSMYTDPYNLQGYTLLS